MWPVVENRTYAGVRKKVNISRAQCHSCPAAWERPQPHVRERRPGTTEMADAIKALVERERAEFRRVAAGRPVATLRGLAALVVDRAADEPLACPQQLWSSSTAMHDRWDAAGRMRIQSVACCAVPAGRVT